MLTAQATNGAGIVIFAPGGLYVQNKPRALKSKVGIGIPVLSSRFQGQASVYTWSTAKSWAGYIPRSSEKNSGSSGCDSGDSALFFRKRNENK